MKKITAALVIAILLSGCVMHQKHPDDVMLVESDKGGGEISIESTTLVYPDNKRAQLINRRLDRADVSAYALKITEKEIETASHQDPVAGRTIASTFRPVAKPGALASADTTNADGQNVREIEKYMIGTASSILARDVVVTSAYRDLKSPLKSEAHLRGAIDIAVNGPAGFSGRLFDAQKLSKAFGKNVNVIVEEVYASLNLQINVTFSDGKVVSVRAGRRGSEPQLHAQGTHIHIQPNKGFTIPADKAAAFLKNVDFSGIRDLMPPPVPQPAPAPTPSRPAPSHEGGQNREFGGRENGRPERNQPEHDRPERTNEGMKAGKLM